MNKIDLKHVDLNLLLVFESLMRERHVTRTAEQLGRTQSAISHALARLREQLNDPLLIKSGSTMQASPFALRLIEDVRPLLRNIERVLQPQQSFDPVQSQRAFRVGLPDIALHLFPALVTKALNLAPAISIEWVNVSDKMLLDLQEGALDVCLAPSHLRLPDGIAFADAGSLEWQCYLRAEHPALQKKWTVKAWQKYAHVVVRVGDRNTNPVSEASKLAGIKRQVAVWVPNFSAVAPLLANTDLIATLPKVVMHTQLARYQLKALAVPFVLPSIMHRVYWAQRTHNDAAIIWLRELLLETLATQLKIAQSL